VKTDIPEPLADQCASLNKQAKKLEGRINCFQKPEHPACKNLVEQAKQQQAQELPLYEACRQQGEPRFNRKRPIAEQRSLDCAYEKQWTGGPNKKGKTWKKLLPAACRENTFVGRDGLDCCTGTVFHDGPLDIECNIFYQVP
jgi:hypothetical protein